MTDEKTNPGEEEPRFTNPQTIQRGQKQIAPIAINFRGKAVVVDAGAGLLPMLLLAMLQSCELDGEIIAPEVEGIFRAFNLVVRDISGNVIWPEDYVEPEPVTDPSAEKYDILFPALEKRVDDVEQYIADHNGEEGE